jgi:hypothetical protein
MEEDSDEDFESGHWRSAIPMVKPNRLQLGKYVKRKNGPTSSSDEEPLPKKPKLKSRESTTKKPKKSKLPKIVPVFAAPSLDSTSTAEGGFLPAPLLKKWPYFTSPHNAPS